MPADFSFKFAAPVVLHYSEHYRIPRDAEPRVYHGFSGATVWRLQTPAGEFALRCWGKPSPPVARLRGLHRLLRFIFDRGVECVSVPVAALNGSTIVEQDGDLWQLEPWMPGEADFRNDPRPARLRNAMLALAAWHNAAGDFVAGAREREWLRTETAGISPAVGERLQKIHRWRRGRLARLRREVNASDADAEWRALARRVVAHFDRAAPCVLAELQSAQELHVPLQPCLRDVWHDHLLFTDDAVTGLIDPAACRTESVAADLARLLGSLVGNDDAARQSALRDYGERRVLLPAELQLLPILDRSAILLSGMTWLDRYYLQRREFLDADAVYGRLAHIVSRFDFAD
ncbi:MAG: phosphotransferase enzyme family protein [Planctomycetaceae bacterium]